MNFYAVYFVVKFLNKKILEILVEGKVLPEYDNKPFVNLAIPINEAVQQAKKYPAVNVMRYIKSSNNSKIKKKLNKTTCSSLNSGFYLFRNSSKKVDFN